MAAKTNFTVTVSRHSEKKLLQHNLNVNKFVIKNFYSEHSKDGKIHCKFSVKLVNNPAKVKQFLIDSKYKICVN